MPARPRHTTPRRRTTPWLGLLATAAATAALALGGLGFLTAAHAAGAGTSQGQAIVNAAAAMQGQAYCWAGGNQYGPTHGQGGTGCPGATKGFDCSGLTLYAVFQGTGLLLPHQSGLQASQAASYGGQVITNEADLLPGDLVFFGGGGFTSNQHVGIYAGNGTLWDAANSRTPVALHTMAWEKAGLPYRGAVRYWQGAPAPTAIPTPAASPTPTPTAPSPTPTPTASPTPSPTSTPTTAPLSVRDGSFVQVGRDVYRVIGGAPLKVAWWRDVGGIQPTRKVTAAQLATLPQYPADGTFIKIRTGRVYRFAGGAAMPINSWAVVGGWHPALAISQDVVDHAGATAEPWDHVAASPADGTMLSTVTGSGTITWVVAGGAATPTTTQRTAQTAVLVDPISLDQAGIAPYTTLRSSPAAVQLSPIPRRISAHTQLLSWPAVVSASKVVSYDVAWRYQYWGGWRTPPQWRGVTSNQPVTALNLASGRHYCFTVRATNLAGQVGSWGPRVCTTPR